MSTCQRGNFFSPKPCRLHSLIQHRNMAVNIQVFISAEGLLKMTLLSVIHQGVSEARSKVSRFLGFAAFLSRSDPGLEDMPGNTLVLSFKKCTVFIYAYRYIKCKHNAYILHSCYINKYKNLDMKAFSFLIL